MHFVLSPLKFILVWSYLLKWSGALQNHFDNLFRKYITYTGGEELFGLPVTQHPQLLEIRKQLTLLQKLYGLYNSVIDTVNGYYEISWADINIDRINNELLEFQSRWEGYRSQTKFSEYLISGSRIISYTEKHESTRAFQLCCFVHGNRRSFSVNWIILHACQGLKLKSAVLEQVPV